MKEFLRKQNVFFKEQVSIGFLTGMNQKNVIPFVVYPDSIEKLKILLLYFIRHNISFDIFAGLSNVYLCESYYKEIIIISTKVCDIEENKKSVKIGCGYNLTKLSKSFVEKGIDGFEGFVGIPGTVGAAAFNNSGAFSSSMQKVILGIWLLSFDGKEEYLSNKELEYKDRSSILKERRKEGVILSIVFDISNRVEITELKNRVEKFKATRKKTIDGKRKSLGSVFVASTLEELYNRHKVAFLLKKIFNFPLRILFHSNTINTYMDFLFLRKPFLAKHCDSLNRFCWDQRTNEKDFFVYIETMQTLADNRLKLEIEIKK